MRWEDELYVKLYTRDTTDWLMLSWKAQGLFLLMLRKCDRAGIIGLGRSGKKGICAHIGGITEWHEIEPCLDELLADGCVELHTADEPKALVIPSFMDAQASAMSSTARKKLQRERARADVTKRELLSRNVNECHAESRDVTPSHAESRIDEMRSEENRIEEIPHSPPGDGLVLKIQPSTPAKPEKFAAEIAEVWAHWLAHWQRVRANGTPPKLTAGRKGQLVARLKEGYGVEQLKQAADGIWADEFCLAKGFTTPGLCYRNGENVEKYAGKAPSLRGLMSDRPGMQRRKDLNDEQKHL